MKEGIERGMKQKNLELTQKMKTKGLSISEISDITELDYKTIENL